MPEKNNNNKKQLYSIISELTLISYILLGIQHDGYVQHSLDYSDIIIDYRKYRISAYKHQTSSTFNSTKTI